MPQLTRHLRQLFSLTRDRLPLRTQRHYVNTARGKSSILLLGLTLLAFSSSGCGSGSSSQTFTQFSGHVDCDHSLTTIGGKVQPILQIHNQSGQTWKQTWLWIDGNDNFRDDGVSLDNAQSTSIGGGFYALGPLRKGEIGDIHIYFTGQSVGAPKITFASWGSSSSSTDVPDVPGGAKSVSCDYAVR